MAKRFDLLYGPTGEGKTTNIIRLIMEMYKETKKSSRVYVGEGSRVSYEDSGLVEAGIVKLVDYSIFDYPLTILNRLTEGWVPVDPDDPNSKWVKLTPEEVANTALWAFEGLTVVGALIMGDKPGGLAYRSARGEKIGQDSPISILEPSGLKVGGNPQSHYGVAQRNIEGLLTRSKALPGFVFWTAHERVAEDQGTNIIGPDVIGRALTPGVMKQFGNTLHCCTAMKVGKKTDTMTGKAVNTVEREYRIYIRDHGDPDGIVQMRYKATCRCISVANTLPEYFVGKEPGDNIVEFYKAYAIAARKWTAQHLAVGA